jgi:hypothetical protein
VNRQPHDPDLKAQARSLYAADGATLAASVTGIPARTIRRWAVAEQWPRSGDGHRPHLHVAPVAETWQPTPKGHVTSLGYPHQRRALLRQLGDEARECLTALATDREAGRSGAARNWAWCVGILLERAELLAKAAGPDQAAGQPDAAEAVARLRELATDLAARRTGSDGQPP